MAHVKYTAYLEGLKHVHVSCSQEFRFAITLLVLSVKKGVRIISIWIFTLIENFVKFQYFVRTNLFHENNAAFPKEFQKI